MCNLIQLNLINFAFLNKRSNLENKINGDKWSFIKTLIQAKTKSSQVY